METQNNSAKFAFYYMLSLVALVTTAVAAGTIVFQIVNANFPDPLNQFRGTFSQNALKAAISALIIAAPIFFIAMRAIHKNLHSGALSKDAPVRRWLTYFILFVASVVMLGWLIAVINSFLDGELTAKFILKAITAIGIAAAIFTFYYYDIRRAEITGQRDRTVTFYFYGSLAVITAVFAASSFYVESPTETRSRKFDLALLERFSQLDGAISSYYNDKGELPESLDALIAAYPYVTNDTLVTPVTGQLFEYSTKGDKAYELCAEFLTSNLDNQNPDYFDFKDRWPHDRGRQCLEQTVMEYEKRVPLPAR